MTPFDLTSQARSDFHYIVSYIAERNYAAALRWDESCVEEFFDIARHPFLAPIRPEFAPSPIRCRVFNAYLIFYDPSRSPLLILRVVHARRNVSTLLIGREVTDA